MKKLLVIAILSFTALAYTVAQEAQQSTEPTLEEIRAARKTMDVIELSLLRSSDDKHAASLILQDKEAYEDVYLYLVATPGYKEALADKTILEFKKDLRSKDKMYRKLDKAASKIRFDKREYIASINPNYQEAMVLYIEATK
jgi:hypothetical protein